MGGCNTACLGLLLALVLVCSAFSFLVMLQPDAALGGMVCPVVKVELSSVPSLTNGSIDQGSTDRLTVTAAMVQGDSLAADCKELQYGLTSACLLLISLCSFLFTLLALHRTCSDSTLEYKPHKSLVILSRPWIPDDDFPVSIDLPDMPFSDPNILQLQASSEPHDACSTVTTLSADCLEQQATGAGSDVLFAHQTHGGQGVDCESVRSGDSNPCGHSEWSSLLNDIDILTAPLRLQSKLLRKCLRLHGELEGVLEEDMLSAEEYCIVVDQCRANGNISGLVLLASLVKASGREAAFLSALRRSRATIPIYTSSSSEGSSVASPVPESVPNEQNGHRCFTGFWELRTGSHHSPDANSSDDGGAGLCMCTAAREKDLLRLGAIEHLEDLLSAGILDVPQYCFLVDLQDQEKQEWALGEMIRRLKAERAVNHLLSAIRLVRELCS